jgi:4-nitrophenyl phosphatase
MNEARWLQQTEAFLIDLDGTLYRGKKVIPDAPAFIKWLEETGRQYIYVTNNSSRRPEQVAEHLRSLGIPAEAKHVYTSGMVAAKYIAEQPGAEKRVYVIGEEGLRHALENAGCVITEDSPDYVVQGLDRQFSYEKLKTASLAIQAGATYLVTNVDKALPTETGLLPGAGSLLAAIRAASGTEPIVMGKPEARMIEYALDVLGVSKDRAVVVGDNLETDILAGVNAGVRTVLVLSGYSKREHLEGAKGKPTLVLDSLTELMKQAE